MIIKKYFCTAAVACIFAFITLFSGLPQARAGLSVEMHLYQDTFGYFCFPYLSTNTTTPDFPQGSYLIASPQYPSNGFSLLYLADTNGFSYQGGGGYDYSDLGSVLQAITNGQWTIWVTNGTTTSQYFFSVTASGINTNTFGFNPAYVFFPNDNNPAGTNVITEPLFQWTGPTNFAGTLQANDYFVDAQGNDNYEASSFFPTSQTNWQCPVVLSLGKHSFSVDYLLTNSTSLVAAVPLNATAQPISGWVSTAALESSYDATFEVTGGTSTASSGHLLFAYYNFNDTNNSGADQSGNGNDIYCSSYWGSPQQTPTSDGVQGSALEFFGTSAITPCDQILTNWFNNFAGSFSLSIWLKTTNTAGNDSDNMGDGNGQSVIYVDNNGTGLIPLGITGSKAAFYTGDTNGNDDTLHSTQSLTTGAYTHVVVTRDQTTGLKSIYVNGALDSTDYGATGLIYGGGNYASIGGEVFSAYSGILDEVQIYSGVLNATEVTYLYQNPGTTAPNVASSIGPVVHYDFDENMTLPPDVTGNGNNIIYSGNFGGSGPAFSPTAKAGAGSVYFDGGSFLTPSSNLLSTLARDFTLSLWVNTTQSYGSANDFAFNGAGVVSADVPSQVNDLVPVSLTAGQVAFNVGSPIQGDSTLNSSGLVNDGNWHHIVVTRSQSTGHRQIFIDGVLDSSDTYTTNVLSDPQLLTLGAVADASNSDPTSPSYTGGNGYQGYLDDLQLYGRVVSPSEVFYLFQNPGATLNGSGTNTPPLNFNTALNTTNLIWTTTGDALWTPENKISLDGAAARSGMINIGQSSTLQTTVNGPGSVTFHWQNVGNNIPNFLDEFTIDGNFAAQLRGAQAWTSNGPYYFGPGSHSLSWTVEDYYESSALDTNAAGFLDEVTFGSLYPPYIVSGPTDGSASYSSQITKLLGSNVVLTCQVDANPAATFRWYKNSVLIAGATNNLLTITNLQFSEVGNYTMSASNNLGVAQSASVFLQVYQPTDLQPLSFSFPTVVSSESLVPFVYSVTNTGPGAVSNYYDYINFSPAAVTPDFSQGNFSAYYINFLVPPASIYTVTNIVRFPNVPAGTYSVELAVDGAGYIIETNETNNVLAGPHSITVVNPDMQPGNLTISSTTNIGGSVVQVSYNTTNNGPGILDGVNWYDELYLSTSSVLDSNAVNLAQIIQRSVLGVGQFTNTLISVTLPINPSGNYFLLLKVDYIGFQDIGAVQEANESNNFISIPIHFQESDLVPTNFVANASVSSHQVINVSWNDLNQGDGAATNLNLYDLYEWVDMLYISTNQQVTAASIPLGTPIYNYYYGGYTQFPQTNGLAAGQSVSNLQTVAVPNLPAGNYYLIVDVDTQNVIREINEANNTLAKPITIAPIDLAPIAITAPPAANSRSTITVSYTVANLGSGTVYSQWVDRLFISTNAAWDSTATLLGEFPQTNVLAGLTNYTETNSVTLPGVAAGNYYLILYADAATNLFESSKSNNFISSAISIGTPDLAAVGLILSSNLASQQPISPVYTVANVSSVVALPGWSDRLYLSLDTILDTNDIALNNGYGIDFFHNQPLPGGSNYSQLENVTLPGVPAGNYYVLVQADGNQFFAEPNFANNTFAQPVHIANPDLLPTNLIAPSSVVITQLNQYIEVDWNVVNQGLGTTYPGWNDYLYISRTNVLDTNAIFVGSFYQNSSLSDGQAYLGYYDYSLPNNLSGNYYLILQVNGDNALYESTITNNILVRPISIVIPPLPVLSLFSVQSPSDAWSGQQVPITWVLTNSGTAAVDGTFYDSVSLTTSSTGANPQIYGVFSFTGQIAAGASVTRQQLITLPISLSGQFWVEVQDDIYGNIFQYLYRTNEMLIATNALTVHLTPVPDLSVTAIQSSTNLFSGDQTVVSWNVTNSGSGPTTAPYWYDAVYLSSATNLSGTYSQYLGSAQNASFLNPGDSYNNSLSVSIPITADGYYYFLVNTDDGNNVFETNKSNNLLASAPVFIHLTPPPDLKTAFVNGPHSAFSGQPVYVQWAVTNYGIGQTFAGQTNWYDRVYVTTNQILDSSAIAIGNFPHIGGLPAEAGYTNGGTVTMPIGIQGNYYFIVMADVYNQVYEGAFEDNNATTATYATFVALTPPPDLATTIIQAPTTALASHVLAVTYTVTNSGATVTPNSGWTDALYISTNSVLDFTDYLLSATADHYGALATSVSYTNTIGITLPDGITGNFYVFVVSDIYNQVFELNKSNNVAADSSAIPVYSRPADLVVVSASAPPTANIGSGILINWSVTNQGLGDTAVAYWDDRVTLSANTLLGSPNDITLIDLPYNGVLGAGGSYSENSQLAQIPGNLSAGTYYLFVTTDANNNVYEGTNKNNNTFGPIPITITADAANLKVTTATAPATAYSGSQINIQWQVKNTGDRLPNSANWIDAVYLTANGLVDSDAYLIGYAQNQSVLSPGTSYTNSVLANIPQNIQGNYYFVIVTDAENQVFQGNQNFNNNYVVNPPAAISLSLTPDLAVTKITAPTAAYSGQNFTVSYVVQNIGTVAATAPWNDAVYLSSDEVLDPLVDTYVGYTNNGQSLAPGASYTNTASFPIPEGYAGAYYVFLYTDASGNIFERNRDNNKVYATPAMQISLLPPVDLVAGAITIPANGVPGQSATVTYTVSNQGSNTALGSWSDALYLSTDTNLDLGDPLFVQVQHTGNVPPGSNYSQTVTASLPPVVPGTYYVILRSDILNHLNEPNKSNNIAASLNSVSMSVPQLTLGVAATGTIAQGESLYFQFAATNGQTIHIQMSTPVSLADNELFVNFGQLPTSEFFTYADDDPFVASPDIYIPVTNNGTFYLLAYSEYLPTATNYSILAEVLPFSVTAVQPNTAGDQGATTFLIRGALFDTNTLFQLLNDTNVLISTAVTLYDSTTAYVTFDLANVTNGYWELQAVMTNAVSVGLSNAVLIAAGTGPSVDVSIAGQFDVRPLFPHNVFLYYGNSGDADTPSPLIIYSGAEGTEIGTTVENLRTNDVEILGRSFEGPPGTLRPQTSESIELFYFGGALHVETHAFTVDSTVLLTDADWSNIEGSVRPAGISDANWLAFWSNIRPRVGPTWGNYVQFLDRIATNFPAEDREVALMIGALYTNQNGFRASSSVSGVLLGSMDNQPQIGVQVSFFSTASNGAVSLGGSAITDTYGNFVIPYIADGTYTVGLDNSPYVNLDMNRDGFADIPPQTFVVQNGADLTNQVLYAFEPPPANIFTNDADATLQLDSLGTLHSFYYHGERLWHAWNSNGQWVGAAPISTNIVNGFAVATAAKLVDGTSPGMIVVWCQGSTNSADLYYAVGKLGANGYEWSQPVQLTSDQVENCSPAVVVRNDGLAVVTYLKNGIGYKDDCDVYYSTINVVSGALLFNQPTGQAIPRDATVGAKQTFGWSKTFKVEPLNTDVTFGAECAGEFSSQDCGASASLKLTGSAQVEDASWVVKGEIGAEGAFDFVVDPDQCAWMFKPESSKLNVHLGVTIGAKNVVFRILNNSPASPVSIPVEKFVNEASSFCGIKIENSIELKVTADLINGEWQTAPFGGFGSPSFSSAEGSIGVAAKFGIKFRNKNDITLDDGGYTLLEDQAGDIQQRFSLSGGIEVVGKAQTYPTWVNQSITITPTLALTFPGGWKFAPIIPELTITGNNVPQHVAGRNETDFVASGILTYDPASAPGTGNVYGTNSVISNVGADLYQDGAPALANDANGTSYQIWYKELAPSVAVYATELVMADFNGTNWTAPVAIPGSSGINSEVSAITDASGNRLAIWVHGDSSAITTNATATQFFAARTAVDLYYSVYNGSSWTTPAAVTVTPGADLGVQLSHMANGNILAVWVYTDSNSTQHLMTSSWNGATWSAAQEITSGAIQSPTAQQIGGDIHLIWTQVVDPTNDYTSLFEAVNSGGDWSKPNPFSPVAAASSANGNVALAAKPLSATEIVFGPIPEKCCLCQGHVTSVTNNNATACGVAFVKYDYTTCRKIFLFKACPLGPKDPNNLTGPVGFGPEQWVSANAALGYDIQFENDPTVATGPASVVSITLPLDANFDPSTFRLGTFGFGNYVFMVPTNSAFYQTRLDFTTNGGFYLDVFAGVDVAHHQAFWTFTTIDPNTGNVPQNALLGFLPPDVTPPQGEGFVNYTVSPKAGIVTGTIVTAQATVVFDNQPPINTPSVFNTLEAGTPASAVQPLPAVSVSPTFAVSWVGVDVPGSPGIASYDIYVAQDGGRYYPWLQGTTLTNAAYIGQGGSTYAFYSIAHDNTGSVEAAPTVPDATTFVSTNLAPTISVITNGVVPPDGIFRLLIHAQDPNGDTLTYSLDPGAPTGAVINSNTGVLGWSPTRVYASTTNLFTVRVTDNGLPPLSATQSFMVIVLDYLDLAIGSTNLQVGATVGLPVYLSSSEGVTNLTFTLPWMSSRFTNVTLASLAANIASNSLVNQNSNLVITVQTTPGQTIGGAAQQLLQINFFAVTNQSSAFVSVPVTAVLADKPGNLGYSNYVLHTGTISVVQDKPLIIATASTNQTRSLQLLGLLNASYQLQISTNTPYGPWLPALNYQQTNGSVSVEISSTNAPVFYRLLQQ